ncbi:hypothetical protein EV424DRAFT_1375488 [Suillus variegatus]|nr:hypothetical protein EV424DRAFT_1422741 [Suillus variegatus]KAG1823200.1 hypothetical protein EV424DRAFT_1397293 [Suillus variegatus]KAG1830592.1 hypothetical protein EV424DRAFT_1375488 [Suillus variegatus]
MRLGIVRHRYHCRGILNTSSVHIGCKVGRLPELIEYHNTTICELEHRNRGR